VHPAFAFDGAGKTPVKMLRLEELLFPVESLQEFRFEGSKLRQHVKRTEECKASGSSAKASHLSATSGFLWSVEPGHLHTDLTTLPLRFNIPYPSDLQRQNFLTIKVLT
jgi:hypothetical protein